MQHVQEIEETGNSNAGFLAVFGIVLLLAAAVSIVVYSQSFILMMIGVPLCLMSSVAAGLSIIGSKEE